MIQPRLKLMLFTGLAFFLSTMWLTLRPPTTIIPKDIFLHGVLATVLAALLLLRSPRIEGAAARTNRPMAAALLGLFLFIGGRIFSVNQIQWLGVIAMAFSCLSAGMPNRSATDLAKAVFILYWANPLPAGIFIPLQIFMQKASVAGAELLLQALNFRVWADGLVIRTGIQIYEIPAWCSGMRTATAVLILSFGIGLHKRLAPAKLLLFTILALLQSLILNIIRISLVIFLAPASSDPTGFQLLHDSSGIILVASLFLMVVELHFWTQNWTSSPKGDTEKRRIFRMAFSRFPETWNRLREHRAIVLLIAAVIVLTGAFAYRCRAYHRSEMIKSVAESLRDNGDYDNAFRAATKALALQPDDEEWKLTRIRMLLLAGRYEDTLLELRKSYSKDSEQIIGEWHTTSTEAAILRAYALIGIKKYEAAAAIVDALPSYSANNNPMLAMVSAEIGFFLNDIDKVSANIVPAAAWRGNERRVRSLYPFLRANRRWHDISDSDHFASRHTKPMEAFCAMEAAMNLDDTPRLAALIDAAIELWPTDYRMLEPLYFMVLKRGSNEWQELFATHFLRCLPEVVSPDALFGMIKKAFEINRADLAWKAYARLKDTHPNHPCVEMIPGYYGERWFYLSPDIAGIRGIAYQTYTDIKPFILIGMLLPSFRNLTESIPLRDNILTLHKQQERVARIKAAREAFRASKEPHSPPMNFEYARMLEMTGSKLELESFMNSLEKSETNEEEIISLTSEIGERRADWQRVYEQLKAYDITERSSLITALRRCRAQINLRLFLAAQNTASKITQAFPASSLSAGMLAETELLLDRPEEALMAIRTASAMHDKTLRMPEIRALFESGRAKAGRELCKTSLIPIPQEYASLDDSAIVAPAEFALMWHHISLPSRSSFDEYSSRMIANYETKSPFLSGLYKLWLAAFQAEASDSTTDTDKWTAIGGTDEERATALNLLTMLLCRFAKHEEALRVAGQAVKFMPDSPILWHPLISLSRGDASVLSAAARHCPDDSDIWLAQLVTATDLSRIPPDERAANAMALISEAQSSKRRISPAGLTRGAAYLLRTGLAQPARVLAVAASEKDPQFLPAQLAALKCAMQSSDRELALASTRRAIRASITPEQMLYRTYVELHSDEPNADDPYLINALQELKRTDPSNRRWPTMLAYMRYLRSGWENIDAFYEFGKAMQMGVTNKTTILFAAEAARRMGNPGKAAEILRTMLLDNPDDVAVLNNLAYTLASVTENPIAPDETVTTDLTGIPEDSSFITRANALDEAMRIVPRLLKLAPDSLPALDTAVYVLIEAGKLEDASNALSMLNAAAVNDSSYQFKAAIHSARLLLRTNEPDKAEKVLKAAIKGSKGISDEDVMLANILLAEVMTVQDERRRQYLNILRTQPVDERK